jgi:hypothetical protein
MPSLRRPKIAAAKAGLGITKFMEDYVWDGGDDLFVPDTDEKVKRLKPVPLGDRAVAFFDDEQDEQLEAIRALRDERGGLAIQQRLERLRKEKGTAPAA